MRVKIFKGKYLLSIFIFLFIIPTIVVAASSDFLSKALQYYSRECNSRATREEGIICYVFEKVQEDDQRDATQAAKIAELESRIFALENPPSPSPTPSPLPEINQLLDFNESFDVPAGYNVMIVEIQDAINFPWAPAPSFDDGSTYVEQHRFSSGISNATIPILSDKYMIGSGAPTNLQVRVRLQSDPNSKVVTFGNNAAYPFTSAETDTNSYNQMIVTASGGNNPQNISAIVLLIKQGAVFTEAARSNCDGGAECPPTSFNLVGGSHKISIEGSGTGALFAGLLRRP